MLENCHDCLHVNLVLVHAEALQVGQVEVGSAVAGDRRHPDVQRLQTFRRALKVANQFVVKVVVTIQIEVNEAIEPRKVLKASCSDLIGNVRVVHDKYLCLMQSFDELAVDLGAILDGKSDQVALGRDVFHDDFSDAVAAFQVDCLELDVVVEHFQQGHVAELYVQQAEALEVLGFDEAVHQTLRNLYLNLHPRGQIFIQLAYY